MILSECHREVRKQRAKPVLGCEMAVLELSISRCPFLCLCLHGHARPWASCKKDPKQEDAGNKGRQTCQTELALTCKLWASGILSHAVQSSTIPPGPVQSTRARPLKPCRLARNQAPGGGSGQTAALRSGRLHSDSRVALG